MKRKLLLAVVAAYQVDSWGNKHHLNTANLGPWSNYTYFWDPATF